MIELQHNGWTRRPAPLPPVEQVRWQRTLRLAEELRPQLDVRGGEAADLGGVLRRAYEAHTFEAATASCAELVAALRRLAVRGSATWRRRAGKLLPELAPPVERAVVDALGGVSVLPDADEPLIVLDTETTGLVAGECQVIEVYALRVLPGVECDPEHADELHRLVRLERGARVDATALAVNGMDPYSAEHIAAAVSLRQTIEELGEWIGDGATIVAHNASFDRRMLEADAQRVGLELRGARWFCTKVYAQSLQKRGVMPAVGARLAELCAHLGVVNADAHRARGDVRATLEMFEHLRRLDEGHATEARENALAPLALTASVATEPKRKRGRAA